MYSKLKKSFIKSAFFIGLLGYSNIALSSFYEDPEEGTSASRSVKPLEFKWLDTPNDLIKTTLLIRYTDEAENMSPEEFNRDLENFLGHRAGNSIQKIKLMPGYNYDTFECASRIIHNLSNFNQAFPKFEIKVLDMSNSKTFVGMLNFNLPILSKLEILDISDNNGVPFFLYDVHYLGYSSLRRLNLSNTDLKIAYLGWLVEEKAGSFHNSLTHLDLSHNPNLKGEGLQQVVDAFPNLEFLDLTDTGIERIEDIPECPLKLTMDVSGNPFYVRGLEDEGQAIKKVLAVLGSISEDGRADQEPSSSDALPNPKPFPSIVLQDIVLRQTGVEFLGAELQVERFNHPVIGSLHDLEKVEVTLNVVYGVLRQVQKTMGVKSIYPPKLYDDSRCHENSRKEFFNAFRAHLKDLKTRRGVKPYLIKHTSAS